MAGYPHEKASSSYTSSSSQQVISRPVRQHLVHVFLTIAALLGVAAIGAHYGGPYSRLSALSGGVIETGAVIGSVFGIRHLRQDHILRWGLLFVYALFSGSSLSSLVAIYLRWDPTGTLLLAALSGSVFIFLGFAGSALLANRRSMLYYGGMAGSLLGIMIWASFANLFFIRSSSMFSAELYLGLIAFAGFVVYDTQMIVERASAGIFDIPGHALELFMDLFALFVRLALIILRKEEERERNGGNRRRQQRRRRQNQWESSL
ncbi:inhibitor of apoptosis-promoting Bax1-domain-containing protein [Halteromyces radiatus]|uniref:inhibitor of apoptosis-promoting Bax1-domain-containing protein n=1 Tax=Halteromyces radiatus TaxID=101107 RepID=UPI002220EE21|nr:inhibitor of apoptosis-promoting Bax1-domain-containing protein [Halteromyces radiatus]KAI8092843.1 inhibitor of apoptosis-promoting Bax1-domain-containing protein [Halteromyces radiatus]